MTGTERRTKIVELIENSDIPLSGAALAQQCDVSRQVIVQDIALIRASGYDIISTNRGYIIRGPLVHERIFKVHHTDEQLEEELYSIVDIGGTIANVMVNHRVYGHMEAELGINSRRKVEAFMDDIRAGKSSPLKNITSNYHYHKVTADSEEILDMIEETLQRKHFLVH